MREDVKHVRFGRPSGERYRKSILSCRLRVGSSMGMGCLPPPSYVLSADTQNVLKLEINVTRGKYVLYSDYKSSKIDKFARVDLKCVELQRL